MFDSKNKEFILWIREPFWITRLRVGKKLDWLTRCEVISSGYEFKIADSAFKQSFMVLKLIWENSLIKKGQLISDSFLSKS